MRPSYFPTIFHFYLLLFLIRPFDAKFADDKIIGDEPIAENEMPT